MLINGGRVSGGTTASLSRPGRAVRLAAALLFLGLLVAGSVRWDDFAFPFGPFRMFATSTPPNGQVYVGALEARMPDGSWRRVPLESGNVGVNRAEVEGRTPQLRADPSLLRRMLEAHDALQPREPRWTGVRVLQDNLILRNRRYVGKTTIVIAEWRRS